MIPLFHQKYIYIKYIIGKDLYFVIFTNGDTCKWNKVKNLKKKLKRNNVLLINKN